MAKHRIAILPGDGIGRDVMDAAKIALDRTKLDAEYIQGDVGWEFWKTEGDALRYSLRASENRDIREDLYRLCVRTRRCRLRN